MRFAYAHKLATYLTVLCAFGAVTLSGELSPVIVVIAFAAVMGSWLWEPPRISFERFVWPWTILSLVALSYAVLNAFVGGRDHYLLVGSEFLLYLLVAKLFNRRSCKDYLHIYVITFLMLVAGTGLNGEFTYGIFFLGYVVAVTWALILFHLRREMEDNFLLKHSDDRPSERVEVARILNSRRIVGKRFFAGTSLVSLSIFAVASLFFLMIPRINLGCAGGGYRPGVTMAGFSDGVRLGGHGMIKSDSTVVMRVEIGKEYQGLAAPYIYWRGVAFDHYDHGEWQRSRQAPATARRITYPRPRIERHHLLYDQPGQAIEELDPRAEQGVLQKIYLEPIGYDVLFGASMPLAFETEMSLDGQKSVRTERNDEVRLSHNIGIRYTAYSAIGRPSPEELRNAPRQRPRQYRSYLQVPPEITPEVRKLAEDITRDARTDYDKVVAVTSWLQKNLSYTLEMRSPGDTEPIHFFLFERKKGHCEYFSSAAAILLRVVGVPTRNVNGFLGGEWNEYNNYIAVRAGDAHSWIEVYFHGVGWVTFDATPSAEVDRLGRGSDSLSDRMRRLLDTVRFKWFKWVIEYDLSRQRSLFTGIRDQMNDGASTFKRVAEAVKEWLAANLPAFAAGLAVLGAAIGIVFQLRRRRRPRGRDPRKAQRTRDPVSTLYNAILARLARRGHRRTPSATPREYAQAMILARSPGASELVELTELYYQVVYGEQAADDALPRARELGEAIEQAFRDARRAARAGDA